MPKSSTHHEIMLRPPPGTRFTYSVRNPPETLTHRFVRLSPEAESGDFHTYIIGHDVFIAFPMSKAEAFITFLRNWADAIDDVAHVPIPENNKDRFVFIEFTKGREGEIITWLSQWIDAYVQPEVKRHEAVVAAKAQAILDAVDAPPTVENAMTELKTATESEQKNHGNFEDSNGERKQDDGERNRGEAQGRTDDPGPAQGSDGR